MSQALPSELNMTAEFSPTARARCPIASSSERVIKWRGLRF
jgi:hypothetical protein